MARRKNKNRAIMRFALLIWLGVLAVEAANVFLHFFGQVMITAIIAAACYYAGRQDAIKRARARIGLRARKPGRAPVICPVCQLEHKSGDCPYKDAEEIPPVPSMRARLLADPMSGVRSLYGSDDE